MADADRDRWTNFAITVLRTFCPEGDHISDEDALSKLQAEWATIPAQHQRDLIAAIQALQQAEEEVHEHEVIVDGCEDFIQLEEYERGFNQAKGPVNQRPEFFDYLEAHENHYDALLRVQAAGQLIATICAPQGGAEHFGQACLRGLLEFHDEAVIDKIAEIDAIPNEDVKYLDAIALETRTRLAATTQASFDQSWLGAWPLGAGGFGRVSLWVQRNRDGVVIDRVVVKDSHFTTSEGHRKVFCDEDLWWMDPANPRHKIPIEIAAMQKLTNRYPQVTVNLRSWRLSRKDMFHRLYLELCPFGDARDLLYSRSGHLPEPFLWYIFLALAVAGELLETGGTGDRPGPPSWIPIIHRDLKPDNVFFTYPTPGSFEQYWKPKLSDFGLAVFMPHDDTRKPEAIRRCGTPTFMAPEQDGYILQGEKELRRLSSKTNVHGIGTTMYELIQRSRLDDLDFAIELVGQPYAFSPSVQQLYSPELQDLVLRCLRYRPENRPAIADLVRSIRQNISMPLDKARGMAQAARNDVRKMQYWLPQMSNKHDPWAVGAKVRTMRGPPGGWKVGKWPHPRRIFDEAAGSSPDPQSYRMDSLTMPASRSPDPVSPRTRLGRAQNLSAQQGAMQSIEVQAPRACRGQAPAPSPLAGARQRQIPSPRRR